MDFDDLNIPGIIFAVIGAGVGILVAKQTGASILFRLLSGVICAVACYFIGGKIADG